MIGSKTRKFGEKAKDKQTVFVVMYQSESNIDEYGVLEVFNDLEEADKYASNKVDTDEKNYSYVISQIDIDDALEELK